MAWKAASTAAKTQASTGGAKSGTVKSSNAKQDRPAMFAKRDKDGDGQLSREEFLKDQPDPKEAPARFLKFDVDKSGNVSREEFVSSGKRK